MATATQELSKHEQAIGAAQVVPDSAQSALKRFWAANQKQIAAVTAGGDVERIMRVTYSVLYRNPKLIECTGFSLLNGIVLAHQMGLVLGTQEVALVPYGREATLIVQYQGKVKLALSSGLVRSIHVDLVFDGEQFEYYVGGSGQHFNHRPKISNRPKATAENVVAAYCQIITANGGVQTTVVPLSEILDARERSRGYKYQLSKGKNDNPWFTDFGAMAKKTAVHRAMKLAPQDSRAALANSVDDEELGGPAVIADTLNPAEFSQQDLQEPLVPTGIEAAKDVAQQKLIDAAETVEKLPDPVPLVAGRVMRCKGKVWQVEESENGHTWVEMT